MKGYDDVLDVIIDLQEKGFDHDFTIEHDNIRCLQFNELIAPDDFEIITIHHCTPLVNDHQNAIIYGIKLLNHDVRGIIISSYKSYLSGMSMHLWKKFDNYLKQTDRK